MTTIERERSLLNSRRHQLQTGNCKKKTSSHGNSPWLREPQSFGTPTCDDSELAGSATGGAQQLSGPQ